MRLLDRASPSFLYQQVIDFIEHQQKIGALSPGDKLPSLRKLSAQFEISVPTIKQAYIELERQGRVCARPQSGYYLTAQQARTLKPRPALWSHCEPTTVQCRSMIEQVHEAVHLPNTVALGISNPVQVNPPDKALARLMRSVISKYAEKAVSYGPPTGDAKLRMQLAFRYQEQGVAVNPNDILITSDTIVWHNNTALGKPRDADEAFQILKSLSNQTHEVITSVCFTTTTFEKTLHNITKVTFKALSDEEILYYINTYKPFDKAGAYGIQEWIGQIGVTKIEGSYFNVMGLPVHLVYKTLNTIAETA